MHQFYYANSVTNADSPYGKRGFGVRASSQLEAAIEGSARARASYPVKTLTPGLASREQPVRLAWMRAKPSESGAGQAFHSVYIGDAGDGRSGSFFCHTLWNVPPEICARDVIRTWGCEFWQQSCPESVTSLTDVADWPVACQWDLREALERLNESSFRQVVRAVLCLWLKPPELIGRNQIKLYLDLPAPDVAACVRLVTECLPVNLLQELTFSTLEEATDAAARIVGCHRAADIRSGRPLGQNKKVPHEFLFGPEPVVIDYGGPLEQQFSDWVLERFASGRKAEVASFVSAAEDAEMQTAAEFLELIALLFEPESLTPVLIRRFSKSESLRRQVLRSRPVMRRVLQWFIDNDFEGQSLLTELIPLVTGKSLAAPDAHRLAEDLQALCLESAVAGDAWQLQRCMNEAAPRLVSDYIPTIWSNLFQVLERRRQQVASSFEWAVPFAVRIQFLAPCRDLIQGDTNRLRGWIRPGSFAEFEQLIERQYSEKVLELAWTDLLALWPLNERWPDAVRRWMRSRPTLLAQTLDGLGRAGVTTAEMDGWLAPVWNVFDEWLPLIDQLESLRVELDTVPFVLQRVRSNWAQLKQCLYRESVHRVLGRDDAACWEVIGVMLRARDLSPLRDNSLDRFRRAVGVERLDQAIKAETLAMVSEGDVRIDAVRDAFAELKDRNVSIGWAGLFRCVQLDASSTGMMAFVIGRIPGGALTPDVEACLGSIPPEFLLDVFRKSEGEHRQKTIFRICWSKGLRPSEYPAMLSVPAVWEFLTVALAPVEAASLPSIRDVTPIDANSKWTPLPVTTALPNARDQQITDARQLLQHCLRRVHGSVFPIGDSLLERMVREPEVAELLEDWLDFISETDDVALVVSYARTVLAHRGPTPAVVRVASSTLDAILLKGGAASADGQTLLTEIAALLPKARATTDAHWQALSSRLTLWKFQQRPLLDDWEQVADVIRDLAIWKLPEHERFLKTLERRLHQAVMGPDARTDLSARYRQFQGLATLFEALVQWRPELGFQDFVIGLRSQSGKDDPDSRLVAGALMVAFEWSMNRMSSNWRDWNLVFEKLLDQAVADAMRIDNRDEFLWMVSISGVAFESGEWARAFHRRISPVVNRVEQDVAARARSRPSEVGSIGAPRGSNSRQTEAQQGGLFSDVASFLGFGKRREGE